MAHGSKRGFENLPVHDRVQSMCNSQYGVVLELLSDNSLHDTVRLKRSVLYRLDGYRAAYLTIHIRCSLIQYQYLASISSQHSSCQAEELLLSLGEWLI